MHAYAYMYTSDWLLGLLIYVCWIWMKLAYIYLVGASHPPLEGGAITGHGAAALCLYAGLTQQQAVQFEGTNWSRRPGILGAEDDGGSCGPKCCQFAPGDGACWCCVEAGDGDARGLAAVGADGSPLLCGCPPMAAVCSTPHAGISKPKNKKTRTNQQKQSFESKSNILPFCFVFPGFVFPGFVCFSRCGPSFSSFRFQAHATKESRNMVPAKALLAAWKGEADDDQTRSHKKNKNSRLLLVFQHFRFKVSQNKKMFFFVFPFQNQKNRENQKNNLSSQNQTSFSQKLRFCFFVLLEFFVCFWFFYWFTWLPSVSLCLLTLSVLGSQILIKVSHSRAWTLCETKLGIG